MTNDVLRQLARQELMAWLEEARQAAVAKVSLMEAEGLEPDVLDLQALEGNWCD